MEASSLLDLSKKKDEVYWLEKMDICKSVGWVDFCEISSHSWIALEQADQEDKNQPHSTQATWIYLQSLEVRNIVISAYGKWIYFPFELGEVYECWEGIFF
jgi:hypothetical protein